jgi:uncharacterized membrane protein
MELSDRLWAFASAFVGAQAATLWVLAMWYIRRVEGNSSGVLFGLLMGAAVLSLGVAIYELRQGLRGK